MFHEVTDVTFKPLDEGEIETYLSKIDPLDKAGAYAAQDHGTMIIDRVEGSWTNVVGLPLERLPGWFLRVGIDLAELLPWLAPPPQVGQ